MKIKEGFMLREVAGNYVVVAVGEASKSFRGLINTNETGAFLFKIFKEGATEEEAVQKLLDEYEVSEEKAKEAVSKFVEKIKGGNLVEL